MPLPIPEILQNTINLINAANTVASNEKSDESMQILAEALRKVSTDDIKAVMHEIGHVYMGAHQPRIMTIGSRPDIKGKALELMIVADFGLGPRTTAIALPMEQAEKFLNTLQNDMRQLATGGVRLITDLKNG